MSGLTKEQIEELKATHGQLYELTLGEAERQRSIVVRMPSKAEWKRFKQQVRDDLKQDIAGVTLVKTVLLDPSVAEFDGWVTALPGLEDSFAAEVIRLLGATERAEKKVL